MKNLISTVAILILILGQTTFAQTEWKQTNGPIGGNITYLTKDSRGYLYALASNSYVYISKNNGDHWNKIFEEICSFGIDDNDHCYIIKRDSSFIIYDENLILLKNIEIPHVLCWAKSIKIDKNGTIYLLEMNYLFISTDLGDTWAYNHFDTNYGFAFDTNNVVIVADLKDSVNRSTNNGRDWLKVKVSEKVNSNYISFVTYNKMFGNFIATGRNPGIIYISTDSGITWQTDSTKIPIVQVTVLYSDDYGNTYIKGYKDWYPEGIGLIYRSIDGGFTWQKFDESIPINFSTITSKNNYLFLAGGNGVAGSKYKVLRHDLSSRTTTEIHKGIINQNIFSLATNKKDYVFAYISDGIFRTTDRGESWQKLPFPARKYESNFPLICTKSNFIFAANDSTVQRSSDDGNTWITVFYYNSKFSRNLALTEADNGRLYLANRDLYFSDDNGETWIKRYSFQSSIVNLVIFKNTFFVASSSDYGGNIYFSYDSALTFRSLPITAPEYVASVATFNKTGDLYINVPDGMDPTATFFSDDKCQTFKKIAQLSYRLNFLKVDSSNNLYTNDRNSGLIFTSDNGITWKSLNNSITQDKQINDLCFVKNGAYLGTQSYSVFKTDYLMNVEPPQSVTETDYAISPNPASDFIEITDINPMLKHGVDYKDIKIYNVFGQIQTTPNPTPTLPASREGVRIDVSGLAPGVYFVRIGDKVSKFVKI